jgi:2-hydroxychromene-2-carboxylate isomerase
MATNKELEARLEEVLGLLKQYGIEPPTAVATVPEERGDYIEHGSKRHAIVLGLVEVKGDTNKRVTFTSPRTNRTFALEDEVTAFLQYAEPMTVAALVLEQKVNELETAPTVPADAPAMFRPRQRV